MFQNLTAKLQAAIDEAEVVVNQAKARLSVIEDREALVAQRESDCKNLRADLDAREAAVNTIENVAKAIEANDRREAKLAQDRSDFEASKAAFRNYQAEQKSLLDTQREELKQQEANLEERAKNMEAELYKKLEALVKKP